MSQPPAPPPIAWVAGAGNASATDNKGLLPPSELKLG